jgi:NTP pyrophosphatase (non-canonical NTP hydrolase)
MSLDELAQEIYDTAVTHGFWSESRNDALQAIDHLEHVYAPTDEARIENEAWSVVRAYIEAQEVRNMGEMLMLAVSELAEALEEHRDGKPVHYYSYKIPLARTGQYTVEQLAEMDDSQLQVLQIARKPEGLAVELADCIIRCLDTMRSLDVNIEEIVREKMAYNAGREHKHGKAY